MADAASMTAAEHLSPAVRELYPFSDRYLAIEDGIRLHYIDEGEGETLLMLHGNPTWSFYYRRLVQSLSGSYRCIAPDHVGCGLSDKPQDWDYNLENHTKNILRLIEELDLDNITLIAHDWGGAIGLYTALQAKHKFKRIILFNTMSRMTDLPKSIHLARAPLVGAMALRGFNAFLKYAVRYGTSNREHFKGAVEQGYLAPYNSWHNRIAILRFVEDIPMESSHPTEPIARAMEQQIPELDELPTMIIWGNQDFVFHHGFRDEWHTAWPTAEFHELEHANHFVLEDAFDDILPLVTDFLNRHPLSN